MVNNRRIERIQSCLYGHIIGDAMGRPVCSWAQKRIWKNFGWIQDFLPTPNMEKDSIKYSSGSISGNTIQLLAMIDSLVLNDGEIAPSHFVEYLQQQMKKSNHYRTDEFSQNFMSALSSFGQLNSNIYINSITNESLSRALPLGFLFSSTNQRIFIDNVVKCCSPTHTSDIAIAGSAVIAWCISRLLSGEQWINICMELPILADELQIKFESTSSPSLKKRINMAIELSEQLKGSTDRNIVRELYENIGAGHYVIESLPTALGIANIADGDAMKAIILATNMGGDTSTIGAIAGAISGLIGGLDFFEKETITKVEIVNNINLKKYIKKLTNINGIE